MATFPPLPSGINSWSPDYLDSLYQSWKKDPESVDPQWTLFFRGFELGANGASARPSAVPMLASAAVSGGGEPCFPKHARVNSLVYHYRDIGHLMADIDPLERPRPKPELLQLHAFELAEEDLADTFPVSVYGLESESTLDQIINHLEATYTRHLAIEYMHIQNTPERRWIQRALEATTSEPSYPREVKRKILLKLHQATMFERFLHTRYLGQKRFSLEGAETLIPMLARALDCAVEQGVAEVVLGMAHRGRLNVLANILQKGYDDIFAEFEDNYAEAPEGGGDVKYHKGYSSTLLTEDGRELYLTLAANPSHLEAVDPVVLGRTRAKQRLRGDKARKQVIPILIHGDAAFCGQGIVAETLQMAHLDGFTTGGTIHLIVNNQIGFTTDPSDAKSSTYCTDVAKTIQAPIFHANADDPESCAFAVQLAVAYRQEFGKDVVVDMWCYRKHGHNESDEPAFTQPKMYEVIRKKKPTLDLYVKRLLEEGAISKDDVEQMERELQAVFDEAQQHAKQSPVPANQQGYRNYWSGVERKFSFDPVATAVPEETLRRLAERIATLPTGFKPHPKVARLVKSRLEMVQKDKPMDWGTVELLAYASLLDEKIPVRLTGQDSRRGTFSHRHAVIVDVNTEEDHNLLNNLREDQPSFCIYDSPLAEASVVGFEYGYSLGDPNMLIIWEAQFGDFANGAQVIIDQFLASAEAKWERSSGLVLLLPHGYEGQGPEHSSARLERFLQLCANNNMQVANLTTPAQYFHIIRRQMKHNFRKPLVIMSPKSLLRHPKAISRLADLSAGNFQEIIDDASAEPSAVRKICFCSGKVYYDLLARREQTEDTETALVRVEQLYPLHVDRLREVLARYPDAEDFVWVQEEPKNMGAWRLMSELFEVHLQLRLRYVGRPAAASPAVGSHSMHEREVLDLLQAALPSRKPAEVGS